MICDVHFLWISASGTWNMRKITLPEFQDYVRSQSLVTEKYIPFYAHWASKFLAFSKDYPKLSRDLQIQKFFNYLTTQKNIADWQIRQADNAVTIYVHQFLDRNESSAPSGSEEPKHSSGSSDIMEHRCFILRDPES